MRTIHKYPLGHDTTTTVRMPQGAEVLTVNMQADVPTLWALVDTAAPRVPRTFEIYGTGWDMDEGAPGRYVGTCFSGPFVWHVFEGSVG